MKKKIIIILIIALSIVGIIFLYNYLRIKFAKIEVILKENLETPFLSEVKVSDFIESINGNIIDDYIIDTKEIGSQEIAFEFINDDNIKVEYSYEIKIIDITKPTIWLGKTYNVAVNSDIDLTKKILCGDDYDSKPNCFIEGEYDLNTIGEYPLVFKAIDSSGNKEEVAFTLNVQEQKKQTSKKEVYTSFEEIKQKYKTEDTKIGIDVSTYQGDIDFKKLKESGVEFVIIRVGYGYDNKNYLDKRFKEYIEGCNENNIDVGIYYYSYADSKEEAIEEANWVLKQIKKYKVTLPIAFDWEEWGNFNEYNLSFFGLTSLAEEFLKAVEKKGYKGMLYSSKNYLENMWMKTKYDIWLAQYIEEPTYEGTYKFWQLCDNGKVDGIEKAVDVDVMYTNR